MTSTNFPPKLSKGDRVAVIAPSSPATRRAIQPGVAYLESMDLEVVEGTTVGLSDRFFAGSDKARAEEITRLFSDESIRVIFAARGGYGSARVLSEVDWNVVRSHPKVLVGFSDTTALQLALYQRSGLVSFSGVLADIDLARPEPDPLVERSLWLALTSPVPLGNLGVTTPLRVLQEGSRQAVGPLIPANLAVLCSLVGTPYVPDLNGAILVLEDVDEHPYRLDRMLNQLRLSDILPQLSGLVFGEFKDCFVGNETDPDLEELALGATHGLDLTVVSGFPYGHHARRLVVPLGIAATISLEERALHVTESALA